MTDVKTAKQAALRSIARTESNADLVLTALPSPKAEEAPLSVTEKRVAAMSMDTSPGETVDQAKGKTVTASLVPGMQTIKAFTDGMWFTDGDASPGAVVGQLRAKAAAVNANDMTGPEATLVIQATALDAIFHQLAFKAAQRMGSMDGMERYLRLSLKAQAQSCRTLEVLAAMKNPTVFARQANVNMGGQQQVNNGAEPGAALPAMPVAPPVRARTGRRAGLKSSNELSPSRDA